MRTVGLTYALSERQAAGNEVDYHDIETKQEQGFVGFLGYCERIIIGCGQPGRKAALLMVSAAVGGDGRW